MCGTVTFAVEAALIATRTPPGLHREVAFERWGVHDQLAFGEVQHEASHGHCEAPQPIVAVSKRLQQPDLVQRMGK